MPTTVLRTRDGVLDNEDRQTFQSLATRLGAGPAKVLLHLHGGLINQASGEAIAARLSGSGPAAFNAPADWEQVYVVWRTGVFETLRTNWLDLAQNDRLYRALLKRLLGFLSGKLRLSDPVGRSVAETTGLSPAEIDARLSSTSDHPFADIDAALARGRPEGRGAQVEDRPDADIEDEFETVLQSDPEFTGAVDDIDAALNPVSEGRGGTAGHGDAAAGAQSLRRLNPATRDELQGAVPEALGRGLFTSAALLKKLVKHGSAIALRVIGRYRNGREHGFQATIVEEILRELYGDLIGAAIWGMMKKDAADHFKAGALGSDLLGALTKVPERRLLITSHSAGAIWASELLRAAAAMPNKPKIDLVFLAPAVRVSHFADMLKSGTPLVFRFRLFAMSDALERTDPVLGPGTGFVYPSSLLYLVSGLFEETKTEAAVDAPILGMQRFFAVGQTTGWIKESAEREALGSVNDFLARYPNSAVYSKTNDGAGRSTEATSHGGFDDDRLTLESVATFFR
jgi:hypothetical protein